MESTDKKSRIANHFFYIILAVLILGLVSVTFVKIVIQKDYQIVAETSCDPQTEKCFVRTCDTSDDSTCPIAEVERTTYYKIVSKKAAIIASCEATVEKVGCDTELNCTQNEVSCSYTFCDQTNLADGEACAG